MHIGRLDIFFVAFIGLFIGLFILIARLSGWTTLAAFYRLSGSFSGECWRFRSGELRWKMGYNNCLTVGVNPAGLYLSVFFLFRLGHPDLFIPWADVSVTTGKRGFLSAYTEFRFRQALGIPFRVNERLGRQILESAGSSRLIGSPPNKGRDADYSGVGEKRWTEFEPSGRNSKGGKDEPNHADP